MTVRYLLLHRLNNYLNSLDRTDVLYACDDETWALDVLEVWNDGIDRLAYGLLDSKTGLVNLGYGWVEEDEPIERGYLR